ncbi:TetR family transcriptional regulator [Dictyobacter alpinus]|uniref:TetR family transcriptional regulator n=1 Tax=Dictyobacter alpinus TaxID=2014873 RepID=A0A402B0T4_9CHLR|nr:TetR family transcriptional regulator [Dictyobacter alpinus]GCE24964.1 TetR family transcriptional regulator [Dictyobacter alpinus]
MTQIPGRRERKKQQTREKIARVAMELFIERGFEQVIVTEVAEAADVSVNTVYNYFPTKEDLFFGLHQPMEASLAGMVRQREKGEPLLAFLRHLLLGSLEHMKAMPPPEQDVTRQQVFRVMRESPTLQARGRQMTESVEEDLAHAFAEDMGTQLDAIVPRLVAQLILTLYARIFAEYQRRRVKGESSEEIHAGLSAMVMSGLALLEHGIDASGG